MCYDDDRIACKITLPVDQLKGNLQFKAKTFKREFNENDWLKHWGEKDGNAFVSFKLFNSMYQFEFIVALTLGFVSNCWFVNIYCKYLHVNVVAWNL